VILAANLAEDDDLCSTIAKMILNINWHAEPNSESPCSLAEERHGGPTILDTAEESNHRCIAISFKFNI
jgi:hypothetical protein